MGSFLDMNSIDTLNSSTSINFIPNSDIIDYDELEQLEEPIKNQYIEFESLGADLIKDVPDKYLQIIFRNLIEHVNENYTAITEYDSVVVSTQKLLQVGRYVYSFICTDCPFNILPNYLNKIEAVTIDQFESYLKNRLENDSAKFKASFIQSINSILDKLRNLQKLRKAITKDQNYQFLLTRYTYYIELVNYGDTNRFLENYLRPVLYKNFSEIFWRTF
jgi:hypothetical protein